MPASLRERLTTRQAELRPVSGASQSARDRPLLPTAPALAGLAVIMILAGAFERFVYPLPVPAEVIWLMGLLAAGFPVVWRSLGAVTRGKFATDFVASL